MSSKLEKKMFGVDKSICRGAEPGYRTLEVRVGKDDTKPKASKLSGGSLRVIGGPKQRWKKTRVKELIKRSSQAVVVKEVHCK